MSTLAAEASKLHFLIKQHSIITQRPIDSLNTNWQNDLANDQFPDQNTQQTNFHSKKAN